MTGRWCYLNFCPFSPLIKVQQWKLVLQWKVGETTRGTKRLGGAKWLGGKRPGRKRLGGETTRGGNGLGAKRLGFLMLTHFQTMCVIGPYLWDISSRLQQITSHEFFFFFFSFRFSDQYNPSWPAYSCSGCTECSTVQRKLPGTMTANCFFFFFFVFVFTVDPYSEGRP